MTKKLIHRPQITKLVAGGNQGPPGPAGPGVGVKQGSFSDPTPLIGEKILLPYALYAMTIDGLFGLKTATGDIKCTIRINGVAVTGLTNIVATSTPQNPVASAANAVVVGDRVTLLLSDNNSAGGLEFALKATA